MDPLSVLGIGGGLLSGAVNYFNQQEQQKYERDMQAQAWAREDTAVQRRAADLEAAGLSKTLAAGSAAGSMAPIRTTTPQMEHPDFNNAFAIDLAKTQITKQKADIARTNADTALALQKQKFLEEMNPKTLTTEDLKQANIQMDTALKKAGVSQKEVDTAIQAERLKWEQRYNSPTNIDKRALQIEWETNAKEYLMKKYHLEAQMKDWDFSWYKGRNQPTSGSAPEIMKWGTYGQAVLDSIMSGQMK